MIDNLLIVVHAFAWCAPEDTNKTHREKTRWELHKNTISYFEQILEPTPQETTIVQPLTSHLKNYPSKTDKTCRTLFEKQR